MKNPIPGIDSFEQEEALFDAKRSKQKPKRPYPRVYGTLYKGSITTDGFDTRVKMCDVHAPIEHLQDCSPKCHNHPTRDSEGVGRFVKTVRRKLNHFWDSLCGECLDRHESEGFLVKRHGGS